VYKANIHDRVNLAAERSYVTVEREQAVITLHIEIDTEICSVMDYFEIYFGRMQLCRRAAEFLGCRFSLVINGVALL
ncbi:MAG: phosphohydrolase, partial [Clostridia bacterium]|nr:phosphohydrolase [Clostridia bacterium]